ncbi:hypothetical protein NIES30_08170 [Phormidium tenue NIES-30]|uniref:Uncharacterized protein n=1 Tax=Phormidium tenue NIES-30 TaxID=549789 RepID=A0A1U7J7L6_9CYAN|nr:hypothetical protein NIES30_08170 [Phormidium tenue NIES-30]
MKKALQPVDFLEKIDLQRVGLVRNHLVIRVTAPLHYRHLEMPRAAEEVSCLSVHHRILMFPHPTPVN